MKDVVGRDFSVGDYVIYASNRYGTLRMRFGKVTKVEHDRIYIKGAWWHETYNLPHTHSREIQLWPYQKILINNDIPKGIKDKLDE